MRNLKTKITVVKLLSMFALAVVCFSCDPEDGIDGEDGAQGEQGIAGLDGQDGEDGKDGNANVIASDWITSDFSTTATSFSTFSLNTELTIDELDTSAILVYGKTINGFGLFTNTSIYSVPYELNNERYEFYLNIPLLTLISSTINIVFKASSIDGSNEIFDTFNEFRYVIIPQETTTATFSKQTEQLKKMSYDEVVERYGLEY